MNAIPARLVFRNRRAKLRAALFGYVGLLESYFEGDLEVDGDLRAALAATIAARLDQPNLLVRLRNRWHEWRHSNASWCQARRNAPAHYGHGEAFYRFWLDETLTYSCAYWKEGVRTLEEAQHEKAEHVCRKLRIAPGDSVVDVGCGFGAFLFHAQRHHGAKMTGINTTPQQVAMVREQVRRRGLEGSIDVVETDFRDARREYDKLVSIGVLEHAGRGQLDEVLRAHAAFLKPGGLGMLHFIGHAGPGDTDYFIREYIFPGGWIPALSEVVSALERNGLEVLDVENLRRHYALTLDEWARRFDRNWERIHRLDPQRFDERFRRTWRAYLVGCAEMFRSPASTINLFQVVFSKGNASVGSYPMTRDFLYAPPPAADARLRAAS